MRALALMCTRGRIETEKEREGGREKGRPGAREREEQNRGRDGQSKSGSEKETGRKKD